jgi:hypothetical protein
MNDYEIELIEDSKKIDHISDINIILKDHQLAIINRCIEIENNNICNLGIMSDKPGTGKTFAILGLIYYTKKKSNIIIVPQNIILQWCESINTFSNGKLKYKKFINYEDILDLYNPDTKLFEYDILLTTSLYYNLIATTVQSNFQNFERIFFDEIDSISSFIVNKINANFIWFVSASFNYEEMGIYTTKIDKTLIPYITCKCNDLYIDNMFNLDIPNIYKIICKNIYLDSIFNGLVSNEEFKLLNAMDYSKLKKKFCNKIAQNEKEAVDFLVKDKIDIIEIEEIRINDINKMLEYNTLEERKNILNKQLEKSKKSLEDSKYKLNLIRDRLKENNCCPLCYNEFDESQKKVISPCCKNNICFTCTNNWFNIMKKTNCIYCNVQDVKYEDYIIIKPSSENICLVCDKEYASINDKYYAHCCKKNSCTECLKDWYHKLLKNNCLFCLREEILFEDFKNEKEHEEMKLNTQAGIKYTKKTKIEFLEYFIRTKMFSNCKIIFCSNYIRIFNDIKSLFYKYNIKYIELDDGNINSINESIKKYTYGNVNALLLNSNLFGCGLNLQCTTDVIFLHKTDPILEKQIIGRSQRFGRNSKLNIWYLMHENEKIIKTVKTSENIFYNNDINLFDNIDIDIDIDQDDIYNNENISYISSL